MSRSVPQTSTEMRTYKRWTSRLPWRRPWLWCSECSRIVRLTRELKFPDHGVRPGFSWTCRNANQLATFEDLFWPSLLAPWVGARLSTMPIALAVKLGGLS